MSAVHTLTTDAKATGKQALGKVHQDEEDQLKEDDRDFVLDVLNYEMSDIFSALGINTQGGEFTYVVTRKVDKSIQINVVEKLSNMGLPISDDYLYETFEIDKPDDYDARKADIEAKAEEERQRREERQLALEQKLSGNKSPDENRSADSSLVNRLRGFFGSAPHDGADPLEF